MRADRRCLLKQLAFSKLHHFSWDNFPTNTMAYDIPLNDTRTKRGWGDPVPTGLQRITSSLSSSKEVNPYIIAGTIHVSVSTVVNEGSRQWQRQRRRSAADVSVDGSGWRAGSLPPLCCWQWRGNLWRTMDDGWRKNVGGRQNYLLSKLWEH
jgi:hypothetical protein